MPSHPRSVQRASRAQTSNSQPKSAKVNAQNLKISPPPAAAGWAWTSSPKNVIMERWCPALIPSQNRPQRPKTKEARFLLQFSPRCTSLTLLPANRVPPGVGLAWLALVPLNEHNSRFPARIGVGFGAPGGPEPRACRGHLAGRPQPRRGSMARGDGAPCRAAHGQGHRDVSADGVVGVMRSAGECRRFRNGPGVWPGASNSREKGCRSRRLTLRRRRSTLINSHGKHEIHFVRSLSLRHVVQRWCRPRGSAK